MTELIEQYRAMVGEHRLMDSVEFSETMVADYLAATGDALEAGAVPPLIAMAFVGDLPLIRSDWGSRGFLAGQAFFPELPIYPGDTLRSTTTLVEVYEKTGRSGPLLFTVWETGLTNQRGETVARCRRSFARQGSS